LQRVEKIAEMMSMADLSVTVRSRRDIFREEQAGWIFKWIIDVTSGRCGCIGARYGPAGVAALKEAVCQALCGVWQRSWPDNVDIFSPEMNPSVKTLLEDIAKIQNEDEDTDEMVDDTNEGDRIDPIEAHLSEKELLAFNARLGRTIMPSEQQKDDMAMTWSTNASREHIKVDTSGAAETTELIASIIHNEHPFDLTPILKGHGAQDVRRRLDYLFLLDTRLWKEMRLHLRELLIVNMTQHARYKLAIGR
jgi:hypothetical protein